MEVTIKKGVPIAAPRKSGPARKYPFHEMEIGDAIDFDDTAKFERARRAAAAYGKQHDRVYTSRKGIQNGERTDQGGTIWRVE